MLWSEGMRRGETTNQKEKEEHSCENNLLQNLEKRSETFLFVP